MAKHPRTDDFIRFANEMATNGAETGLSTTEQIIGALLLNRPDLLPRGYTQILHALWRLDPEEREALIEINEKHEGYSRREQGDITSNFGPVIDPPSKRNP